MKKPSVKSLLKLWGQVILARDKRKCQKCGEWGNQPHHIFTRARAATKYELSNGITLCFRHHTGCSQTSAHLSPRDFEKWLINNYMTIEELEALERKSRGIAKYDDLESIQKELKRRLKEYENTK